MSEQEKPFFDVSMSDIMGGLLKLEENKAMADMKRLENQSRNQQRALHEPSVDSMQDAIDSGYVNQQQFDRYWQGIPKPLLYSSGALLAVAVLVKVLK